MESKRIVYLGCGERYSSVASLGLIANAGRTKTQLKYAHRSTTRGMLVPNFVWFNGGTLKEICKKIPYSYLLLIIIVKIESKGVVCIERQYSITKKRHCVIAISDGCI